MGLFFFLSLLQVFFFFLRAGELMADRIGTMDVEVPPNKMPKIKTGCPSCRHERMRLRGWENDQPLSPTYGCKEIFNSLII